MQTITAQQSRDARRELGLSQADVTKALEFNRQYLSEFETGFSTRFTNAQLKKLRTLYEERIAEANANGEQITLTFGEAETDKAPKSRKPTPEPDGIQRTMLAVRHLSIDHRLSQDQITGILEKIAANDREAEDLLQEKVERGILSDWSERTDAYLKAVFGLFAANYVLLRHLQGRPMVVLEKPVAYADVVSIADLFANLFHEDNGDLVTVDEPELAADDNAEVPS